MPTILVIDDEPGIRRVVRLTLEFDGHTILEADSGADGLALFDQNEVDLVITDLFMNEGDGLEVLREVRARGECPVIVMSGGSHRGLHLLPVANAMGARVVAKPFMPEELRKVVDRSLLQPP